MNLLASLRYLMALDKHRHFGRAAESCHITQPALSNALRTLEREFGVVIVKRSRTYVGLTPEGERVLATAQRMVHEHQVLQEDLSSKVHRPNGSLRIGAVPTAVPIAARFGGMLQVLHPGIVPAVVSMSSLELETGLENLSIDLALGYTDRMGLRDVKLNAWPQYVEYYFLLRRAATPHAVELQIGPPLRWRDAAALPLCLLSPDMHNRTIVDAAFVTAGTAVKPAIETNSILTLALSVVAGGVCSIMPGALVGAVRGYRELEALPLMDPEIKTAIGFMSNGSAGASRALEAALALARDAAWLRHAAANSGLMLA